MKTNTFYFFFFFFFFPVATINAVLRTNSWNVYFDNRQVAAPV